MKRLAWVLSLIAASAAICSAQSFLGRGGFGGGAGSQQRIAIAIKSDGSSVVTNENVSSRAAMEQGIRMREAWEKRAEGDAEEVNLEPAKKTAEVKPYTDQELAAKIREMERVSSEQYGTELQKIEAIEITTNTVRLVRTGSFASLRELLSHIGTVLGGTFPMDNMRLETTNSQLRVTLSPLAGMQRYARVTRQQWKTSGAAAELRIIFPGKVLASGLPATQGNATWISAEGEKAESIDALVKMYEEPTVIVCESGGLTLETPLDSKPLQRLARRPGAGVEDMLPITDAGPGFIAEGVSVTTSTLLYFPEGEKYLRDIGQFGSPSTGTVVRARLFAPRGRTIKSVSGVRVIKAIDDKGHEIGTRETESESEISFSSQGNRSKNESIIVALSLQLPPSDAGAIAELSAEAITLTVGKWKEFTVTNLQVNATNEIDLSSVMPGATLALTKVNTKRRQLQIQARLKGPKEIRQLELQCQQPGSQSFNTYANEMNFSTRAAESTRTINVQGYGFEEDGAGGSSIVLVVRSPDDLRRERVRFSLKDIDLF